MTLYQLGASYSSLSRVGSLVISLCIEWLSSVTLSFRTQFMQQCIADHKVMDWNFNTPLTFVFQASKLPIASTVKVILVYNVIYIFSVKWIKFQTRQFFGEEKMPELLMWYCHGAVIWLILTRDNTDRSPKGN